MNERETVERRRQFSGAPAPDFEFCVLRDPLRLVERHFGWNDCRPVRGTSRGLNPGRDCDSRLAVVASPFSKEVWRY